MEGLRNVKVFIRHGLELVVVVFMEQYIVGKVIDEGQFGCIREAIIKESGMHVVLKIIRSSRAAEGLPHPVVREAVIAVNMSHPFVVRTFETFVEGSSMILVMERCYSTVAKLLAEHSPRCPIPRCLSRRLMYMLISGVQYVHQQNVLHRDVKPSNCLLTESFVLKLGDFGLSRPHKKGARMTHEVETRWYRAPELILGNQNYGEEIDIWSVGCVLAELARGYGGAIFQGVGDLGQLALVFDVLGTPDKDAVKWMPDWDKIHFMEKKGSGIKGILPQVHPLELDLITRILVLNPKKRPSATEILSHPCFSEYS